MSHTILFLSGLVLGILTGVLIAHDAQKRHTRPTYVYRITYHDFCGNPHHHYFQTHILGQSWVDNHKTYACILSREETQMYYRGLL